MSDEATFRFQQDLVALCSYPGYEFKVTIDGRGTVYLQAVYSEPDTENGVVTHQSTRRWLLSPNMTRSEIVQTVFKCVMTSMEHRAREWFRYKDQAVFGPHFNVDDLYDLCVTGRWSRRERSKQIEDLTRLRWPRP